MSKSILITGASTGIGAETARLLSEGNRIFIHYHSSAEAAERVAAEVDRSGGKAFLVQADLAKEDGCRKMVDAVAGQTDKLDVLFNNAGGLIERKIVAELEWNLMERVFALNTFATMLVTALCIPLLEKGDSPCIINMSSIAIRHGAPTATIYGASKAAVDSYTRGAAKELAPAIRVNAVAPGVIITPFHDDVTPPEKLEELRQANPLQKNGEAIHVARAVKFLIENDFVNGETIDINGGFFMR